MGFKNLFIFILGVATGAGGTYFLFREKMMNQFKEENEKRINEELEACRGINHKNNKEIDKNEPDEQPEEETTNDISEPEKRDLDQYKNVLKKVDYTKVPMAEEVTTMTDSVNKLGDHMTEEAVKKTGGKKTKVPKKVSQAEFDSTDEDGRAVLYFYADGVLADKDENQYDPTEIMGATNLKSFKSNYDTIYIFNYAKNMMFEIQYSNSSFRDLPPIPGGDNRR